MTPGKSRPSRSNSPSGSQRGSRTARGRPEASAAETKPKASSPREGGHVAKSGRRDASPSPLLLYGHHAVLAALENPARPVKRLLAVDEPDLKISAAAGERGIAVVRTDRRALDARIQEAGAHQGVALECSPLPSTDLRSVTASEGDGLVLILDQITDSRNFGAILRSAAAFGVRAAVVQTRHAAPLNGACAKAASGALERVPVVAEVNLARAIAQLQGAGYWLAGLDGAADTNLADAEPMPRQGLVLGAEGRGLRPLVAQRCDRLVRIPITPAVESLNVAVAAGIALAHYARVKPALA